MTEPKNNIDTSAHQEEYQLKNNDALDIALLANVVGTELTQVDKFAVGGLQKATRISQEKIFNKSASSQPPPVMQNNSTGMQNIPVQEQMPTPPVPRPEPQPQAKTTPVVDSSQTLKYLRTIDDRLIRLEKLYESILKNLTSDIDHISIKLKKNDKN